MADKKLSELTETTTGSDTMQLFVNDSGVSKRITRGNLISGAVSAATTTYSIKAGTQIGGAGLELDAGGAGTGTDTVKLMESGSATVTRTDADTITIGATNTTYVDATTSVAGLMSTADKTKIDGVSSSANNYVHPSGDGNLHVPATSTSNDGKVLTAGSTAGAVTWETISTTTWDGGATGLTAATGRTSLGLVIGTDVQAYDATIMVDGDIGSTVQAYDADTTKNDVANTFTADQTFTALTETKTTKSASFTPNLSTDGTLYSCSGTMTITMPSAEAGKSFTIIHATATSITWAGTIKWSGGSAPTAGSGIDVYTFVSDGTNWYGMQAGTGFA